MKNLVFTGLFGLLSALFCSYAEARQFYDENPYEIDTDSAVEVIMCEAHDGGYGSYKAYATTFEAARALALAKCKEESTHPSGHCYIYRCR